MLQTLTIRNLALLEQVSLELAEGFTAVTGETGAGKSILLGALSLLAGERRTKTVIRQGAQVCEVEAALWFAHPARIDAALRELNLPECEEGLLLLKRTIAHARAPKISVNGSMTALSSLQKLGELWIDFHGPSEPRQLLKPASQLQLLDLYAQNQDELARYAGLHGVWRRLVVERNQLATQDRMSPDQIEFLGNQLKRLDALDLEEASIAALERDFGRLDRAQQLMELAGSLEDGLNGEGGIGPQLAALQRAAQELAELDEVGKALVERLEAVGIEIADLAGEYAALGHGFHFEPEEVESLQARMEAWLEAQRNHGQDLSAVVAAREDLRRQLEDQTGLEEALPKLDHQVAEAEEAARAQARKLRKQRVEAAGKLAKTVANAIARLGFEKAEFTIEVLPQDQLGLTGDCGVEFLFSPNVGEAVLPLARIASSGELARVMLALKTVLAELDQVPVLVFDEVDANVGGEIGSVVGEQMAQIGQDHQVLCVTHLPQVAAHGHSHLVVEKDQSKDRVEVSIRPIHAADEDRKDEIARMLGDRRSASARAHAEQLLGR